MKSKVYGFGIISTIIFFCLSNAKAQLNPLASQYYNNLYQANAAMAGYLPGLRLNIANRSQLSSLSGKPLNTSFTLDYGINKVGIGLNFYNDQAGLLNRSKLIATYAYHIPLSYEDSKLHFGFSVGFQKENLNNNAIQGSPTDPIPSQYNDRGLIINGDFGLAFTSKRVFIEASLININKQTMIENQPAADYGTFYTSISYLKEVGDWLVKPKLVYRGVRNYKDLFDVAVHLKPQYQSLAFLGMYHSYKSYSFGLSYQPNRTWQLLGVYNTSTTAIRNYANGTFEIGLQFDFSKSDDY
jgi:type IX secretion system PorP/SprF family membrane protein